MNPERIQGAADWIEEVTGNEYKGDLHVYLKNGIVLCELINKIKANTIKNIGKSSAPFIQMQNINSFLDACKSFGVPKHDLFLHS